MKFGVSKCAYMNIEKGQICSLGKTISINGLDIAELKDEEPYKYLGIEENRLYRGELCKERLITEYIKRVRKIWTSELCSSYKSQAHNMYALPVLTYTFGILDWSKDELEEVDKKTRKQLTMSGSFHVNSDVDRLYTQRSDGGRGLKSVWDTYISRLITLEEHINTAAASNCLIKLVKEHECERLLKTASSFRAALQIEQTLDKKGAGKQVPAAINANHLARWLEKPAHGYIVKKQTTSKEYSKLNSNVWLKNTRISSHIEGYYCAIQEQEINTRYVQQKRAKAGTTVDSLCRHCKKHKEDICHIIGSCSKLCHSMYLPFRHDQVARLIYMEILHTQDPQIQMRQPEEVYRVGPIEVWWNKKIACSPPTPFNRPDIVLWNNELKTCKIIEVGIPLDDNVGEAETTKHSKYIPLAVSLKRLYPQYFFECIPIVLGATGLITRSLTTNISAIGLHEESSTKPLHQIAEKAVCGTVKIAKSALTLIR